VSASPSSRVLILWSEATGYLLACVGELSSLPDMAVTLVVYGDGPTNLLALLLPQVTLLMNPQENDWASLRKQHFDVALICGWHLPEFRRFAQRLSGNTRRVLHFDNQWTASARQLLGQATSRFYVRRVYDAVFVPGRRQAVFAAKLGFRDVTLGSYSCDHNLFSQAGLSRQSGQHDFLFAGRLVPEKGITDLVQAYALYRKRLGRSAWKLNIVGRGPLASMIKDVPGIAYTDFLEPPQLRDRMASVGAFILPSTFEPWGVVVHEAASAGLPIIASRAVGSGDDFVRNGENGIIHAPGNIGEIAEAMLRVHAGALPHACAVSTALAATLTPAIWSQRLLTAAPTP